MKAKSIGNVSIIYGLLGSGFGIFALLFIIYFVKKMLSNFKSTEEQFFNFELYFNVLYENWLIYMPIMIGIGVVYILSGFLIKKGKKEGILFGIFAAILNLIWFVCYATSINTNIVPVFPGKISFVALIGAMIISGLLVCSYPIYFLLRYKKIDLIKQ